MTQYEIPTGDRRTSTVAKRMWSESESMFPLKPPDTWFPEACQQANVLNFTWHCFRHTFANGLVMAGVDLRTVQELRATRAS